MSSSSLSQNASAFRQNNSNTTLNVFSLLQQRQSGGRVTAQLKNYTNERLVQNIKDSNSNPVEKKQDIPIKALDIQNCYTAVLRTDSSVQVLNDKGSPLWTHKLQRNICSAEKIKIVGETVICWDAAPSDLSKYIKTIRMFHLYSGRKLAEIKSTKLTEEICILGEKRLFCALNNGDIKEWNFKGKLVQTIKSGNMPGKLIGLGTCLIHIVKNHVNIHNVEPDKKSTKRRLVFEQRKNYFKTSIGGVPEVSLVCDSKKYRKILNFSDTIKPLVTCACIDNDSRLLVGFQTHNAPDFCVVDLLTGTIKEQFRANKDSPLFANTLLNKLKVNHITKDKTGIYLSYSNDRIFSLKLPEISSIESRDGIKTVQLTSLGRNKSQITDLKLQGSILASTSSSSENRLGSLKLWDVSKVEAKKIAAIQLPPHSFSHIIYEKIVFADQKSLVINDYLSTDKSPLPTRTMREACSIQ